MTDPGHQSASPLRLYNTMGRAIEEFKSREPGRVLMYTCGPTVYHFAHIGNMRSFLTADVLRRTLEYNGYSVTHVKNITDVGHLRDEVAGAGPDRIEAAAREAGQTVDQLVDFYTKHYLDDEKRVNLLEPSSRPRATQYIAQMIELAGTLISQGHAYASGGNVYFDVSTFPGYGALSGNRVEDLVAGHRVEVEPGKHAPADFALWKAGDPDRLMNWESPWGIGFPGWHIECSVMASSLLGPQIDIHTGGVDNLFPHHEDERAQSEAATGQVFARYWVHTAHLLKGDEKMSRSLGNFSTVSDLQAAGIDPVAYRFFLLQGHYRKQLSWTPEALEAAQTGLERLWDALADLIQEDQGVSDVLDPAVASEFLKAINDDLGVPRGLALLQQLLDDSRLTTASKLGHVRDMDKVFGLELLERARARSELTDEQRALIDERAKVRSARDWAASDELRLQLSHSGVEVRDTPTGQRWIRRG